MKTFAAKINKKSSAKLMSVSATNLEDAEKQIIKELSKPGRKFILEQWQEKGSIIVEITRSVIAY